MVSLEANKSYQIEMRVVTTSKLMEYWVRDCQNDDRRKLKANNRRNKRMRRHQ